MTLTSYTKYCLENGSEIVLNIANMHGFNEKQIAKLQSVGARFESERGWMIDMNKDNYKEICKNLKGFHMGYFMAK